MNGATEDPSPSPALAGRSGRGWSLARVAALLLAVALLSPVNPVLLVGVPLAVMLLAFRPGGAFSVLLAAFLLWLSFSPSGPTTPLWYGERAWALLTGGAFVLATLLQPRASLPLRSIAAAALGFLAVSLIALLQPGAVAELDWWMASELRWMSRIFAQWFVGAEAGSLLGSLAAAVGEIVEIQVALYPSLLALATLAALGVGWYITIRLAGARGAVGPLREFGFSDHFIWLVIGGLLLFLLPIGDVAARIGSNVLAFMGGLYVVRGVAVLVWLLPAAALPIWSALLWGMLALFLYPLVIGLALVLGISDTWLHLRTRIRGSTGPHGST